MKFSIITVCRNAAQTLEDTIVSVINQTYNDIEYIIIDGASTDGTLPLLNKYRDKIYRVISEPDFGIYDAMNKGLAVSTGDIVGFLNADDLYADNNVVQNIATSLRSGIKACYTDLLYVKRHNQHQIVRNWKSREYSEELFKKGWCPPHLTFFARKEVYDSFGGFDTAFVLAADFEILLRFLLIKKISVQYLPFVSVKMRMGGVTNNSVKNVIKQNIEILRAYKKHCIPISVPRFLFAKVSSRLGQYFKREHRV